ncbi:hypothetical protein D3C78_1178780 [compost metagenome]
MADRAPGGAQTVIELVHRQHQAGPGRLFALGLEDPGNGGAVVGEDLFDGRLYVLGADRRERRQVVGLQKRVVHAHGWHLGWKKHRTILITIDAHRSYQQQRESLSCPFASTRTTPPCSTMARLSTVRQW